MPERDAGADGAGWALVTGKSLVAAVHGLKTRSFNRVGEMP